MTVKTSNEVTLIVGRDVTRITTFYKVQSSTSTPAAPTTTLTSQAVGGWSAIEPSWDGTATNSLYTVQRIESGDGSCLWGAVSKSSSYEAAKQGINMASAAQAAAAATGQHFWDDAAGAHVTEAARDEWEASHSGHNVLINSLGILLRKALAPLVSVTQSAVAFFDGLGDAAENVVARFGRDGATIGRPDGVHVGIDSNSMDVTDGNGTSFLHAGLANDDETGLYSRTSYGWPGETEWLLPLTNCTIDRVAMRDVSTGGETVMVSGTWTYDGTWLRLATGQSIAEGHMLVVTYSTDYPVPAFTAGIRTASYDVGEYSAVLGQACATGYCSMATGHSGEDANGVVQHVVASGEASQAMGIACHATARASHALGRLSAATGDSAMAWGYNGSATGRFSTAGGHMATASGDGSTALGSEVEASGLGSAAIGVGARATQAGMIALGDYNDPKAGDVLEVGDGTSDSGRRNALRVTRVGELIVEGDYGALKTVDTNAGSYAIGAPAPSSDKWGSVLAMYDSVGNASVVDQVVHRSTGELQRHIAIRRRNADNTGNVDHGVRIGITNSGSNTVEFLNGSGPTWRRALGGINLTTIFSGLSVAKGGTLGTNTRVFDFIWFEAQLSSGGYLIGRRTGSTSAAGLIHAVGGTDDGTSTYTYHCRLSVSTTGLVKVVGASRHKLTSSGASGEVLNVTALYGLS